MHLCVRCCALCFVGLWREHVFRTSVAGAIVRSWDEEVCLARTVQRKLLRLAGFIAAHTPLTG